MSRTIHFTPALMAAGMLLLGLATASTQPLTLVSDGRAAARIVLTAWADSADRKAASLLQTWLRRMSGATLPIVTGPPHRAGGGADVLIASAGRHGGRIPGIDWTALQEDGFTLRTVGGTLVIAGGSDKGVIRGVATLLESLGCRCFGGGQDHVPHASTIQLPAIDVTQVPPITFRMLNFFEQDFADWHGIDKHQETWGLFVHTFKELVPPERWFARHPEYFSLLPGGRVPDAQLCLTNPDVFRIVVGELRRRMAENPRARYWSVSQNDTFSPCGCAACRAIDSAEGSPAGSMLAFVNRVAEQFPDKIISMLAYQYTRSAPRTIRPRDNVNIMLCSIECNRSRPLDADPGSASFVKDVEDWTALTHNIFLWDYVVQFRNLLSPFPNLRVLQPNIRFFVRHGITTVFEQGQSTLSTEFAELRTHLLAKLLWNPDVNVDSVMDDFLSHFYGTAGPVIRRYIDRMHDALEEGNEPLWIYGHPRPSKTGFLSAANLDACGMLFDEAEAAVRSERVFLTRVQKARLPLQFALLEQAKILGTAPRGCFEDAGGGRWRVVPAAAALLDTFVTRCEQFGVPRLEEHGTTPEEYRATTRRFFDAGLQPSLTRGARVRLDPAASPKYRDGDARALTDGLDGWADYSIHWLGFEGTDMDAIVDLDSITTIRSMRASFLQDLNSWVFLPDSVEFLTSMDGRTWTRLGMFGPDPRIHQEGAFIKPCVVMCEPRPARHLRVRAVGVKTCPPWHKGAGGRGWVFCDEIRAG